MDVRFGASTEKFEGDECPHCGSPLAVVLWQVILIRIVVLMLLLILPFVLYGGRGFALLLVTPFLVFPARKWVARMFFSVISPRFRLKPDSVITLFKR